jgi:hypothetical protein
MKKLPLFFAALALFLFCACKKTNSSHNTHSNANDWLSSVTNFSLVERVVDSFSYDSFHRIVSFQQFAYDTSGGYPSAGRWSAIFSLPADSSAPPSAYTNDITGTPESHLLSYDGQGRIVKDSSAGASGWIIYFSYPDDNIAITALYFGTVAYGFVDTLFMSGGNLAGYHIYKPNTAGTADSLEGVVKYGFSAVANPVYHPSIARSIGPLIYIFQVSGYGGIFDAVSENVLNSISGQIAGLPSGVAFPFDLVTDSQGRLTQQSADYGGGFARIVYRYY